jgi:hypothetical protein
VHAAFANRLPLEGDAAARLLDDVRQLVREEAVSGARMGAVMAGAEGDGVADGEGVGVGGASGGVGGRPGVDADVGQIDRSPRGRIRHAQHCYAIRGALERLAGIGGPVRDRIDPDLTEGVAEPVLHPGADGRRERLARRAQDRAGRLDPRTSARRCAAGGFPLQREPLRLARRALAAGADDAAAGAAADRWRRPGLLAWLGDRRRVHATRLPVS